jgi:hypothetical protein
MFLGRTIAGPDVAHLARNLPHVPRPANGSIGAVEGHHDHLSRRVDVTHISQVHALHLKAHADSVAALRAKHEASGGMSITGQPVEFREPPEPPFITPAHFVVDHQPPQPSDDHEWNAETRRWDVKEDVQTRAAAAAQASVEIARLEHEEQPGILRDVALGKPGAVDRLRALDERIAALQSTGEQRNGA